MSNHDEKLSVFRQPVKRGYRNLDIDEARVSSHVRGMDRTKIKNTPDRRALLSAMDDAGMSLHALSKKANIAYSSLHGWLTGDTTNLRTDSARKLARALELNPQDVFTGKSMPPTIRCVGRVGAGMAITMYESQDTYNVPAPPGLRDDRQYECLEVDGWSMPPAKPGWLVFYQVEPVSPDQLINEPCVVRLEDGRLMFKVLRRYGDRNDLFTLESWSPTEPPIERVRVAEARPFAALTPGR